MDIATLSQQFCDHSNHILGLSPDTIARYRTVIRLLQSGIGINRIDQCTQENVRQFFYRGRAERHWSASTFATYRKSLAVFFRWCVAHRHLPENPVDGIEVPKSPRSLPPKLTRQQALRVLEVAQNYPYPYEFLRHRNHAVLATVLYAGVRKKELQRLKLMDVDLDNRSIFVRRGKGAKDRIVPMDAPLVEILRRYLADRRRLGKTCPEFFTSLNRDMGLTNEGLKRLVKLISRASGVRFTLHGLRHTFATLMLEGGCNLFALSQMMGHSDIKTTTIYLAATADHLRAQMAKHPLNYP